MCWDDFYNSYWDWSDSTIKTRISSLEDIGDTEEVIEVLENFVDQKLCSQLIRKALRLGKRFSVKELQKIEELVSPEAFDEAVEKSGVNATMFGNTNITIDNFNAVISINTTTRKTVRHKASFGSLLGALFSSFFSSKNSQKDSGVCNGDCANCPPHYGYRHGRWYYGHDHQYGCERGGNAQGCSGKPW